MVGQSLDTIPSTRSRWYAWFIRLPAHRCLFAHQYRVAAFCR